MYIHKNIKSVSALYPQACHKKKRRRNEEKMDIKEKISEIVEQLTKNPSLMKQFEKEPIKAVEQVLGVDLPDDIIEKIISGVKAKVTVDNVSKAADTLKDLFQK